MQNRRTVPFLVFTVAASIALALFAYQPIWEKVSSFRPWSPGLDLAGGTILTYDIDTSKVDATERSSVVSGLRDVIEKRVNLFGVAEPRVYLENAAGADRLVIELAGIKDVNQAIGQIGATPFFEFRTVQGEGTSTEFVSTNLTGRYVKSASVGRDETTFVPEIDFTLTDEGGEIFRAITRDNIGKPVCLFIDGAPILPESLADSCPSVQGEITGGRARITGNFSLETAKSIVERFNAGALPAPITLVNQQTIDGDFGADSLNKAIFAGAIGTAAVIVFMLAYYHTFGIFAGAALLMYAALSLGLFKLVPVTMTLSGIAGFILTIGMAVDANILVFERTKEEMKKGVSREAAIEEGFKRAWTSIRDSNVSTMITAAVLYYTTSGFVRGFALTLFLGVVISMFSAITITRNLLRIFMGKHEATN